jgi:hypothetical protein
MEAKMLTYAQAYKQAYDRYIGKCEGGPTSESAHEAAAAFASEVAYYTVRANETEVQRV